MVIIFFCGINAIRQIILFQAEYFYFNLFKYTGTIHQNGALACPTGYGASDK